MYKAFFKRFLDIALSLCGIIVLSPIFLILSVAIIIDDPGPVFFAQKRVGIHKTHFNIIKFRTMKVSTPKDIPTHLMENSEQYITRFGKYLRKTSLDELPQIVQIFLGKMSVVGPRPALWNQHDLIGERDKYGANDIMPGLTGWAQVNGRDAISIEDKARFDGEYANNISFLFDAKCFLITVFKVFRSEDVVEGKAEKKSTKAQTGDERMKIWIFNNYNMLPEHGALTRSYFFDKQLKIMGHEPVAFVGSHPHNTSLQLISGKEKFKQYPDCEYPWVLIKTCNYEGSRLKRVYSMFEYYFNLRKAVKHYEKPDAIIGSSAHPLAAIAAIKLSKKYRCKGIVEIRDLWPESFVAYGIIGEKNPLMKLLYAVEKWIYKKADAIIFTMEGGKDYIVNKGWDKAHGGAIELSKVFHINNGVDLEEFNDNQLRNDYQDIDLNNPEIFKVVYTGSIRLANQVHELVDVAKILREKNAGNVKILIWGAGDQCERINRLIQEEGLTNIEIKGCVPKAVIPQILSKSDLNVYLLAKTPLADYGLSLNKSFEYFASGKPVIASCNSGYSIIDKYRCGVCLDDFTAEAMANEIIRFCNMPKAEYEEYCKNAIRAAHDYDFKTLTEKLIEVLKKQ